MQPKTTWEQAQEALARGDFDQARELVIRLLRREPNNVQYWLFLSAVVRSDDERVKALKKALELDPDNPDALRGLAYYTGSEPPAAPQVLDLREHWQRGLRGQEVAVPGRGWRLYALAAGALLALVLLMLAGRALWERVRPRRYGTIALITAAPTTPRPSATPSPTLRPRFTPTPVPLEAQLPATYTPTPRYIATPHPVESYLLGLKALDRGDWEQAVLYFEDVLNLTDPAPDVYFYLGEAYRLGRQWDKAEAAFRQAMKVDPDFGPAYVGLARVLFERQRAEAPNRGLPEKTRREIETLFQKGLALDPNYGEGYLAKAQFELLGNQDPEAALKALQEAEALLPGSPLVAYWKARAYLSQGDLDKAREAIQQALDADITHLPTYLLYAQIALAQEDLETAARMLQTYRTYRPEAPEGIYWQARLAWEKEDYETAVALLEAVRDRLPARRAEILERLAEGYLRLGEPEKARPYAQAYYKLRGEQDFEAQMLMGRMWFALEKYGNAYQHFHRAVRLAQKAQDDARYYTALYWRARALSRLNQPAAARRDWQAILEGPEEYVPEAWKEEARAYLFPQTATPTP